MSYKDPIRISPEDPICSATAMNGTIIGILFNKKGSQIKDAIQKRVLSIEEKVTEYKKVIEGIETFLEDKTEKIKELDEFYSFRSDEKDALLRPINRKIEDLRKDIDDKVHVFNKETEKQLAKKALSFEEGFNDIRNRLKSVDDLIKKEEQKTCMPGRTVRGQNIGIHTGPMGTPNAYIYNNSSATTTEGNAGITESNAFYIYDEEDKALAKLNTLKYTVRDWERKVEIILQRIRELEEEKRRLNLIQNHIEDDYAYKLDLNKLSAFGFEDIAVK